MLKDLFLTPGRFLTRHFIKEKKRTYRSSRSRPTESLGTIILSVVCWLVLAGCILYSIDKAGFLKQALDVGLEVATSGETEDQPSPSPPTDSETSTGSASGTLLGPITQTTPSPAPGPSAAGTSQGPAGQPAVENEQWLVILHSIPKNEAGRKEAERRRSQYVSRGLQVDIFDTDAFPNLQGRNSESYWIVGQGPYDSKAAALKASEQAKSFNSGLMVRRGL